MDQILEKIHGIQKDRMSGRLRLRKNDGEITVYFQNGMIDGAGSNLASLQLGRILAEKGHLPPSLLPRLLEKARRNKQLLGKEAVVEKLVDQLDLREGVREQVIRLILHALDQEFQVDSFNDHAVELYQPAHFNFDRLVLELARKNLKPFTIDPGHRIGLNNGQSLAHLPWYPQEVSVLSLLKTPCTLPELTTATGLEQETLDKILCVFDTLNLINRQPETGGEEDALVHAENYPLKYLVPEIDSSSLSEKLEAFHNASSFISEQFKSLKVRIGELSAEKPLQVIAISSPQPADGKSLICANLAVSFSKDPKRRVLVIDCDLRNPSLHKLLGIPVDPGLLGYFENDRMQSYCHMRRLGNLYLMTAGGISENPVELLSSPRMRDLIAELRTEFDTILLDCPPYGPISDAQLLTGMADGMIMVVRRGKTGYGTLGKACRNLERSKLIGLVFNDVKPMMFNTQYDYRYYHYRSYYPYQPGKAPRRTKTYLE